MASPATGYGGVEILGLNRQQDLRLEAEVDPAVGEPPGRSMGESVKLMGSEAAAFGCCADACSPRECVRPFMEQTLDSLGFVQ
jgi:hypothetical protein